jgi:putative transposase
LLTVIDEGNREGLKIAMGLSVPSRHVIRVLDELVAVHGCPSAFRVDYGPEFSAQTFVDWCAYHHAAIHYIQPGKPDQNAYIERFNRSYRTEVLNAHLFESVAELRALTDTWLRIYNSERPHDSLGRVPPLMFLPRAFNSRSVSWQCLLDGEAYEASNPSRSSSAAPPPRCRTTPDEIFAIENAVTASSDR